MVVVVEPEVRRDDLPDWAADTGHKVLDQFMLDGSLRVGEEGNDQIFKNGNGHRDTLSSFPSLIAILCSK